jgi:ferredoxin
MKLLESDKLTDLAAGLAQAGFRVIAPIADGPVVRLAEWKGGAIELGRVPVNSIKDFLMPRSEVIGRYTIDGDDFTLQDASAEAARTVVLAARPCDAAGLALLDAVMNWDFKDEFYNARRAATTVITVGCSTADEYCFCTSVGGAPDGTSGADAVLRPADGGKRFVFEPLTDKAQAVLQAAGGLLTEGQAAPDAPANVEKRFEVQAVTDWLAGNFDSQLWTQLSLACMGCGACAYACPTCHCFDIQDESTATKAVRLRNWDTCAAALFTLHASGHNPRHDQSARWRQRVMHKFSYIPQRFAQLGCTGCGRCGRLCPNGLAIADVCGKIQQECKAVTI